jgi:hypothetical protein
MLAFYLIYLNYNHLVDCYAITIIIIFFDVSLVQGYLCYLEVVLIKNVFLFIIIIIIIIVVVARERRRSDRPPTKNVIWGIYIWSMWGDKEFFVS